MSQLQGRIALVTGGARGIGAATARTLARAGAKVVITDMADGSPVATEIGGAFTRHDVTDEASWVEAIGFARQSFGGLDILVNNAGIFFAKPIAETTIEDFRRMQAVNVEGVFLGIKHAIPAIAERAEKWVGGGSIVNLSSVAGLNGSPLTIAYNASKGAVRLMSKSAALECAAMGLKIRVNSVHPGVIQTKMGDQVVDDFAAAGGQNDIDAAKATVVASHPIGRFGKDTEIADAILFLASDQSSFVTGSELVVDGGLTAR
jgi:NAD(P)-dependent dehydrogenase (short-subunit alcohol dehydrogenase family)